MEMPFSMVSYSLCFFNDVTPYALQLFQVTTLNLEIVRALARGKTDIRIQFMVQVFYPFIVSSQKLLKIMKIKHCVSLCDALASKWLDSSCVCVIFTCLLSAICLRYVVVCAWTIMLCWSTHEVTFFHLWYLIIPTSWRYLFMLIRMIFLNSFMFFVLRTSHWHIFMSSYRGYSFYWNVSIFMWLDNMWKKC